MLKMMPVVWVGAISRGEAGLVVPIPTLPPEVTTTAELPLELTWKVWTGAVFPIPTLPEELMASPDKADPLVVKAIWLFPILQSPESVSLVNE